MSKRKNRNRKPNLPKATLERARLQAEGVDVDELAQQEQEEEASQAEEAAPAVTEAAPPAAKTEAPASAPVTRRTPRREDRGARRRVARTPGMTYSQRKNKDELDQETIRHLLAHPTKQVSEEELRRDYSYVLNDIRSMLILTVFMVTLMIVLGLLI